MPKSNDLKGRRDDIRARMQAALRENNTEGFYNAFDEMLTAVADDVRHDYEQSIGELRQEMDGRILAQRGVRQLTSDERNFYQRILEAMRSSNPQQALSGVNAVLPETVVNDVMEELRTRHPILNYIDFTNTGAAVKWLMNTNAAGAAAWGALDASIVTEVTAGFKEVDITLAKLSAFLPVAKAYLDLGPEWLDRYVRETLAEHLSAGLEQGIVDGTGKDQPIGMTRQVGDDVTVTAGVYPRKTAQAVTDLSPATVGSLLAQLAKDGAGKDRPVSDVILVVNPVDYFTKIFPATTVMAADGTYRKDVLPYPMTVIQSSALESGKAVLGLAKRYFAGVGTAIGGKIEASDHAMFLEDKRVYIIKAYANGQAKDNNAFIYLDISGVEPLSLPVTVKGTVSTKEQA